MEIEKLILILQIINKNGNIENLRKVGLSYSQIVDLINYVIEQGYAKYGEKAFELTEHGNNFIIKSNKELNRKPFESMISPQSEYIKIKKGKYEIYLPEDIKGL